LIASADRERRSSSASWVVEMALPAVACAVIVREVLMLERARERKDRTRRPRRTPRTVHAPPPLCGRISTEKTVALVASGLRSGAERSATRAGPGGAGALTRQSSSSTPRGLRAKGARAALCVRHAKPLLGAGRWGLDAERWARAAHRRWDASPTLRSPWDPPARRACAPRACRRPPARPPLRAPCDPPCETGRLAERAGCGCRARARTSGAGEAVD
jgi:hypothetical protein